MSPRILAQIALTLGALIAAAMIVWPFITPISWALALTILVKPLYDYLRVLRVQPSVAALVMTTCLGICLVIPTLWLVHTLFSTAVQGLETLAPHSLPELWERVTRTYPGFAKLLSKLTTYIQVPHALDQMLQRLTSHAELLLRWPISLASYALLTLFIVFFLLRDSGAFIRELTALMPFAEDDVFRLFSRIHDTIHATLFGIVAVAALQGFLGALLLYWLTIPGAIVWGVIMMLLAVVPYLGAFIVWIPLAAFFALQGEWQRVILTSLWGTFIIGLSDNFLYPIVVGKRLHYHSLVVFFFLLGGVLVFGAGGFVLGPIVLAASDQLLRISRAGIKEK